MRATASSSSRSAVPVAIAGGPVGRRRCAGVSSSSGAIAAGRSARPTPSAGVCGVAPMKCPETASSVVTTRHSPVRYSNTCSPSSSCLPPCAFTTSSGSVSEWCTALVSTRERNSPSIEVDMSGRARDATTSRISARSAELVRTSRRKHVRGPAGKPDPTDLERIVQEAARNDLPRNPAHRLQGGMPLDHYVTLGRTGLRVSPFGLGAMTFGDDPGSAGTTVEESEKILATYLDQGGNFVDTANFYSNTHSEAILGDWFAAHPGRRDRVVLATKFF